MSISSTDAQDSTSPTPPASSLNPSSHHGFLLHPSSRFSPSPSALASNQVPVFGSLQISDCPESSHAVSSEVSEPLAPATADSDVSSKKVTEMGGPNGKRNLHQQKSSKQSQTRSAGREGIESFQSRGKLSRSSVSVHAQQGSGSIDIHGNAPHSSGRKTQVINGNHLLNFHYDPISRPQTRAPPPPPPRRLQKIKPYNKDLFLQANYKFVVLDSGDYRPESMDPDKMLQWEDIICVKYSTPHPMQCPICLEYPLCPQITSCGHIFCFPCILQYLFMGLEDHKGDCWKKCPLCFTMMCSKDLYTIFIEQVKYYCVGDTIEFMLLTRQKNSNILSQKYKQEPDAQPCGNVEVCDSFSKFTFTSDVDLSVREAMSELDGWLARADSGLVDDLEKLPYVCAAMEQLEQRKKYWKEHKANNNNRADKKIDCQTGFHVLPLKVCASNARDEAGGFACLTLAPDIDNKTDCSGDLTAKKLDGACLFQTVGGSVSFKDQDDGVLSSSNDEKNSLERHSNGSRDIRDRDLYNFYQAVDGQHLVLHPLNMKCLLHHYGSYDMLPHRISGKILQLETVTQSEAMRRRYRYLSHFSLTTTFQLCEIDLSEILPPDSLSPFMDEIKKREKQRKQLARKEHMDKIKAEASEAAEAASAQSVFIPFNFGQSSYHESPDFSTDDFEALGNPAVTSSSPPTVGERRLFSSVTRLGFAAGHDSPALKVEEAHSSHYAEGASDSSSATGSRSSGIPSFANVISKEKSVENLEAPKMNESGKKGKKPTRVLMSTAGGRRY
ncbi:uncharacterized protein LOC131167725 isoform X2 [Malania oleifera]|uniref:uncharacterized protein LOC131167725 isoform X2 n=1 Tax=Malania oleifera TaxID=397392 RepID=UPI0025AE051B|nr:uncharacterized protein LOC131167725 isoform X2 [Malania oleifera]